MEYYTSMETCSFELVRWFGLHSELYESGVDDHGISQDKYPGNIPRDLKALSQWICINMTHARMCEWLEEQFIEKKQCATAIDEEKVKRAVARKWKQEEKEQKQVAKIAKVAK